MGAKPFHKGHFELIELAAKECDNVIVFGSLADRKVEGEFPIDGKAYLKFWHDMFIPILPKNVKFKFSESPISSVYMQLRWFEQSYVQDEIAPPTVRIYSDPEDLKLNWKDEVFMDPKKAGCPTLFNAGKIERNEVARGSKTTDISGTKMRKFLETGDKESFLKNLPPVTDEQKEEIWSTLIQKRAEKKENTPKKMKEENLYKSFISEIIDRVYNEMFNEGGWRNVATQDWEVKPPVVAGLVYLMDRFLNEFNQWSGLPELKHNGPAGSGTYYKDDLKDNPDAVYGDVDMMMVLPVDTNDRPTQLESNKLYGDKIREFIDTRRPNYIHADLGDESFGFEYLIFNVSIDDVQAALKKLNMPPDDIKKISSNLPSAAPFKVQVDMMKTYTVSAEWTKIRATPQRGLKGFVTGKLLSTLSDALQITIGTSTNPYINTVDGKIVGTAVKKNAVPVFFNPNEVFLEVLKYYGNLAGVQNVDPSPLAGHYGLNEQDPSLKKKMETVVALANAFEKNGIFDAGVIVSKSKTKFTSRDQFIKYVLDTFIEKMEDSKMAPKLDKAQTPAAFRTVDKIKQHADIGINTAKEIIKEGPSILSEAEGKSIAAIDANTIKTVNGQPAAATTKLKIVGPDGKDVKNKVSSDVKELVHALNGNIGFWKKDNPYIENGFVFNGSSQYLMSGDEKYKELAKYKSSFGDIDVIVPKSKLPSLKSFLDGIDDNKVEWTPTSANKITNAFHYVGNPKGQSIPDQMVTLWYYTPTNQVVQVDFEGDDMFIDPQGYEKPSEWIKFSKDSPWEDLVVGIKGLAGALMLRSLARAATVLPNAVVLTPGGYKKVMAGTVKELTDKEVTKAAQHSVPSAYTLNTGGGGTGIRKAYEFVKTMPYNGKMVDAYKFVEAKETKPEDRIIDVSEIFKILFKKAPSAEEKASFRSYRGLLNLAKKYMDRNTINLAMSRFSEILSKENLKPEDVDAIRNASKEILGISI